MPLDLRRVCDFLRVFGVVTILIGQFSGSYEAGVSLALDDAGQSESSSFVQVSIALVNSSLL